MSAAQLRWRPALSAGEREAVAALIAGAVAADGVEPLGEAVVRELSDERTQHLLAFDDGGEDVIGYLNLALGRDGADATAELVVDRDSRNRGVGAAMVRAAADRAAGPVRFWAHGTLPAARAVADKCGLVAVRELLQLGRTASVDTAETAGMAVPQGIRISTYGGAQDRAELLRVNNAAFSWHPEQGGWSDAELDERMNADWFDPAGLFLAFDDDTGSLLGFHWTKVHPDGRGEVYVLAVDPAAQGRGLGRLLTGWGLRHLAHRSSGPAAPPVMLYVESDNTAAVATYRGLGFSDVSVDTAYRAG